MESRICPTCGVLFEPKKKRQVYCSSSCVASDPVNIAKRKAAMNRPEVREKLRVVAIEVGARPEIRRIRSINSKEVGSREDVKKKRSAATRRSWQDPDIRIARIEHGKETKKIPEVYERWQNNKNVALRTDKYRAERSETALNLWSQPWFVEKVGSGLKVANLRPGVKERRIKMSLEVQNRPESIELRKIKTSQMWSNEEIAGKIRATKKTREHKKMMSEMMIKRWMRSEYRNRFKGANHWNWNGGSSYDPYHHKFNDNYKNRVRAWFDYECCLCHKPQSRNNRALPVHHINYDRKAGIDGRDPECVCLCDICHAKTNKTDEQLRYEWEIFFRYFLALGYDNKCCFAEDEFYT